MVEITLSTDGEEESPRKRPKTPEFLIASKEQAWNMKSEAEKRRIREEEEAAQKKKAALERQQRSKTHAAATASYEHSETPQLKALFNKTLRDHIDKVYGDPPAAVLEAAATMKNDLACCLFLSFASLAFACYANEMLWWRRFTLDSLPADEQMVNLLKICALLCSLADAIFYARFRYSEDEVQRIKCDDKEYLEYFGSTPCLSLSTLKDILFLFVQPMPFVNRVTFTVPNGLSFEDCTYNIDVALITFMLCVRLPVIFRFVQSQSKFWTSQAVFQRQFILADPSDWYLFFRYYHHLYPLPLHLGTIVAYVFSMGYAYYLLERAAVDWPRPLVSTATNVTTVSIHNYTNATNTTNATWDEIHNTTRVVTWAYTLYHPFWNDKYHPYETVEYLTGVWYQAITAGTIGYGQYLPYTFTGRFMAVLALIFGTAYVGLVISAVEDMMELQGEEPSAINALDEHAQNIELEYRAAALIQSVYHLNVEANMKGIQGAARYQYMNFYLDDEILEWKEYRRQHLVFRSTSVDLRSKVSKLYTNAAYSQTRQHSVTELGHNLVHRQDALQIRQEKVEHSLMELDAKLRGITAFLEEQSKQGNPTTKPLGGWRKMQRA